LDVEAEYRRFGPMVLRRCRALLRDQEEAVDAMHDVFVRLIEYRDRLDGRAPASLLLRMATHVCLNRLRTGRRRPAEAVDARVLEIARTEEPEGAWLARLHLGRAFRDELASTRVIAVLHHVDGLTHDQVAREVGLSVSGVRKRLRTLRARLENLEDADAA
jgi:RNA polymerase sigma-70 factor (ECF subfamily)